MALHLVVVTVVTGCALLGWWQLERARDQHAQSELTSSNASAMPVPLSTVLDPGERLSDDDVGRPVTATGRYDAAAQLLVPDRRLDGNVGYVVLTPLLIDNAAVVVIRGWIPAGAAGIVPDVPEPPAGTTTVTGPLSRTEEPPPLDQLLPSGQLGSVHLPSLVNLLPYPLYDAVLSRVTETPAPAQPIAAMPPVVPARDGEWPVQNLVYAVEWWAFGLAAAAMWLSAVRRHDRAREPAAVTDRIVARAPLR